MKIYIAGKISEDNFKKVKEKFKTAEYTLKKLGYEPVNPLNFTYPTIEWSIAMKIVLPKMLECNAIYFLQDWRDSEGARIEHYLAEKLKMKILYQS